MLSRLGNANLATVDKISTLEALIPKAHGSADTVSTCSEERLMCHVTYVSKTVVTWPGHVSMTSASGRRGIDRFRFDRSDIIPRCCQSRSVLLYGNDCYRASRLRHDRFRGPQLASRNKNGPLCLRTDDNTSIGHNQRHASNRFTEITCRTRN